MEMKEVTLAVEKRLQQPQSYISEIFTETNHPKRSQKQV